MSWLVVLILALDLGISFYNAWAVGSVWSETAAMGGLARLTAWAGAVMAAVGFTWVYLFVLGFGAHALGYLPTSALTALINLGYLAIIIPLLGSGLVITISSWVAFARRRSLGGGLVAGYNTFADAYNTYQAIETVPGAIKSVVSFFSGAEEDEEDNRGAIVLLVVLLAVFAVLGGVLTTVLVVRWSARSHASQRQLAAA